MPTFRVFEVFEETKLLRRCQVIDADSADEALDIAANADLPPDGPLGDTQYSASGFEVRSADESDESDDSAWQAAVEDLIVKLHDT
jgi:hypothetical protein